MILNKNQSQDEAKKANKIAGSLNRIMPNLGGFKEEKSKVISSIVNYIILYGVSV